MATMGPLKGSTYGKKSGPVPDLERAKLIGTAGRKRAPSRVLEIVPGEVGEIPGPPEHLGEVGRRIWDDLWSGYPKNVLSRHLDRAVIERIAQASDEREVYRDALNKLGPILVEPICTARGDVVGERACPNPAESMLRRLDKQIAADGDRLGQGLAARARLGLNVSRAELAANEAEAIVKSMYRKKTS
jgi:P27 family predicted phage terminase small subunit